MIKACATSGCPNSLKTNSNYRKYCDECRIRRAETTLAQTKAAVAGLPSRRCRGCSHEFRPTVPVQRFHSEDCRRSFYSRKFGYFGPDRVDPRTCYWKGCLSTFIPKSDYQTTCGTSCQDQLQEYMDTIYRPQYFDVLQRRQMEVIVP